MTKSTVAVTSMPLWNKALSEKKLSVSRALTTNRMNTLIMNLPESMYLGCMRFISEYDINIEENAAIMSVVRTENSP